MILASVAGFVFLLRKKRKQVALMVASTCISVLAAEYALRIWYPQFDEHEKMFERDAELGWKFIPNKTGSIVYHGEVYNFIRTNSHGFRDRPRNFYDKQHKMIMVLGDSFVSNISVDEAEVFTQIMERKIPGTEVVNLGVNGYNQIQEYLVLKKWLETVQPDLVMVMIYIRNDFMENMGSDWLYSRPYASIERPEGTLVIHLPKLEQPAQTAAPPRNALEKLHLYRAVEMAKQDVEAILNLKEDRSILTPYTDPEALLCNTQPSVGAQAMYRTMERMVLEISTFAANKKVPVVFALAPSIWQVEDKLWSDFIALRGKGETYSRSLPNDRLMRFAKSNGIEMIDLLPTLLDASRKGEKMYHAVEQHWTKEGNLLVARVLVEHASVRSLTR